ncbi:MAG: sulfatase [Planctomycetes bacterium]|nr:sulfatase [Planctomycetota bacterium]
MPRPRTSSLATAPVVRSLVRAAALAAALCACGDGDAASRDAASVLPMPSFSVALDDPFAGARTLDAPAARNVVLISIDTLRADHLGCYGYARETSPRLDAFAAANLRFAQCTSAASRTTPSHMSMLSGFLPPVHGQWNYHRAEGGKIAAREQLPHSLPLLAERLRAAAFTTAAFADGGYVTAQAGFDRGFAVFDSRSESVGDKVDRALAWWDAQPADGPRRFLFVHTYEVHAPYIPPAEHDLFTDPAYDGKWRRRVDTLRASGEHAGVDLAAGFLPGPGNVGEADREFLIGLYDGCIRATDAEIGRLLDALLAGPEGARTAILVTADHGEAFGEHGDFGHASLFEDVIHVPFLLHVPGLAAGVADTPISGVDTTPTLLDALGLPSPGPCEGRSALRAPDPGRTLYAFHAEQTLLNSKQAWRRGDLKVHMPFRREGWKLFDVRDDPGERTPIEGREAFVEAARGDLEALAARHAILFEELRAGQSREKVAPSDDELDDLRALGYLGDAPGGDDEDGGGR